ncbi:MAG: TetR/AcrR family transcriptional regulator [Steroidobacteraceae bacterium]|nr:TetR/AcrR family transcriptional regulator [Nevskiaceae bacterium]
MTVPPAAPARPRRKLDREETERRLVMAFDRVWTRDGIQGLGVNAVLKEAGVGKALLYRYFGDFVGLARAWAEGETFLPKPIREQALAQAQSSSGRSRRPQVAAAIGYAQALRARPKIRELLIVELLRSPPVTDALDDLRARFGREMRELAAGAGAIDSEDVYAFSFIATAAMTYLALRAEAVPDYYGLKLDREESWQRIEQMLERLAARLLEPVEAGGDAAASPGKCAVSATASEAETAPVSPRPPRRP